MGYMSSLWKVIGFRCPLKLKPLGVAVVYGISIITATFVLPPQQASADSIVTVNSTTNFGTGTTISVNKPAGVLNNDFLVAHVGVTGGGHNITAPAGWTTIVSSNTTNSTTRSFWKRIDGTEGSSFVFDSNQAIGRRLAAAIVNYRGVDTDTTPIDVTGSSNSGTSSTSVTGTSVTTVSNNAKLVGVFNAYRNDNTSVEFTPPSGMMERVDVRSNTAAATNIAISITDEYRATAGATGDRTATASNTAAEWSAHMFALEPDGTVHMLLLWDGTDHLGNPLSLPAGWSFVDDFNGRLIRGDSVANYGAIGGVSTHSGSASVTVGTASGAQRGTGGAAPEAATYTHSHSASVTVGTASSLPAYRSLRLIRHDAGIPNVIPNGAIALFDDSPGIPGIDFDIGIIDNWDRVDEQDNRFVMSDNAVANGGSDTHTHTLTWSALGAATASSERGTLVFTNDTTSTATHTHNAPAATTTATNNTDPCDNAPVDNSCFPPHVQTLLAKVKADTPTLSVGITAMFDGAPGGGWVVRSDPDPDGAGPIEAGPYYQKYLRGSATYAENLGALTHTHSNATVTSPNNNGGSPGVATVLGAGIAQDGHNHLLTASFTPADNNPLYFNVVVAEKVNFILEYYGWFEDPNTVSNAVTDPWSPLDIGANMPILTIPVANRPPDYTQELRLRLQISVNNNDLSANEVLFKLQYKAATDANCTTGSWTDVPNNDDTDDPWRYADSPTTDGSTLTNLVFLDPYVPLAEESSVSQLYVKSNNQTFLNPNGAIVGERMEYDFHIQHNDTSTGAIQYSFRIVEFNGSSDTLLSQYGDATNNLCPTLTTKPQTNNQLRHGNFFDSAGIERGFSWSD